MKERVVGLGIPGNVGHRTVAVELVRVLIVRINDNKRCRRDDKVVQIRKHNVKGLGVVAMGLLFLLFLEFENHQADALRVGRVLRGDRGFHPAAGAENLIAYLDRALWRFAADLIIEVEVSFR